MKWHAELIEIIRKDFADRKEKNPRFSLRSYAQRLGLSSGSLSDLLNEKRNWQVSKLRAAEITEKLSLSEKARNKLLLKMDLQPKFQKSEITKENYDMLTDWTYYPILFSFDLPAEHRTPEIIARKLGVPVQKVESVIEDLIRRKFLIRNHLNQVCRPETFLTTTDSDPEVAQAPPGALVRKHHEISLDLAKRALNEQPSEVRDITSLTFAGNKQQLLALREEIRKLYDKASTIATLEQEPDTVYRLSVQLFPVEFP
ncbi:hypothetical protein AZI86_11620 [Bdellovibrio bacteriovorus]|uniref:DUF4423 domain-containing protein n=1 Tax=Bdellovibrio bacteriovorus TaxID=959 RepID=A0A150WLM7_BDEBC|nr:TIGR02147 family protein [Bdellovibrio bacteriovorus]KYG64844.1 hypothetical protein AZI86_11620 [Bdellovibrio bacteriovorus]